MKGIPTSRRQFVASAMAVSAAAASRPAAAAAKPPAPKALFGTGPDGQRIADLGDGTYRNPVLAGDHADPAILKDGADYYLVCSSFDLSPGALIWHSTDLVNWSPLVAALTKPLGTVWAMDLVKHAGRYFIYIPVLQPGRVAIYVIHADNIRGPWSEPIDLGLEGCIDPGHAVGEDGRRHLFFNGIRRIGLTDDGLATVGKLEHAHTPWRYPEGWVVEMFAPEGPKILRRGEYFYMIAAVGGTSGPATSHMVTVARSRSIHGPWEDCPSNPVVHTASRAEPWWSRGHASVVQGPGGDWWMAYHGYENGYRTLGRQLLLEPIEWTPDGWLKAKGGTLDRPLAKPRGGQASAPPPALSDDFSQNRLGLQWFLFDPAADERPRVRHEAGQLVLEARGKQLADSSALLCTVGDRSYQAEVELEIPPGAKGGLALFYDAHAHVGVGMGDGKLLTFHNGDEPAWLTQPLTGGRFRLRVTNREHDVTFHYAADDGPWLQHSWQREVSGFHHNVFNGFLALRLAIFAAGTGEVRFRNFRYRGLA
jgi:xylan 1,4-beta-xylosidase